MRKAWIKDFEERNIFPTITGKHLHDHQPTQNSGSYPIDEIFASSTLQVEAAGYMEFGHGKSDHRPIWVNFTRESFLGAKLQKLQSFEARKLKMIDPRVVERYNQLLEERLMKHGVYHRTHQLLMQFSTPMTEDQIREFEKLDKIRTSAMRYAERNCRKLKTGAKKWSPKFQKARDKIKYLALTMSKNLNRKVGARVLIRLAKKVQMNASEWSIDEIQTELKTAYKEYKKIKAKDEEHRMAYMEKLAEAYEQQKQGKENWGKGTKGAGTK